MTKSWFAVCACVLMLAACMHTTRTHFVEHFTLSAPAPSPVSTDHANHADRGILQIASIVVPDWLHGTGMYYRLGYKADGRSATYANSDWIAPPATLLEPLLQKTILEGGEWRAVTGPRNPASADVTLQLSLDDFSQNFSRPRESAGVLDATATLISTRDARVIAQRHFHIETAAPTPDAQGGAKALDDASTQFAAELQRWLQTQNRDQGALSDR